ncbi:hypothetical protein [Streptomyces sp. NPDC001389]|uniref:hypothetical protein n=1 Tax=unclassified Streptomyces TaxID=2593676 RepID=UPI00367DB144
MSGQPLRAATSRRTSKAAAPADRTAAPPIPVPDNERPGSKRQAAWVMAATGAPLTLAVVAMHFLPGPGFPLLAIGLSLLITGLVMSTSAHR